MPSSYSTTGLELPADGEQSGAWGETTNTNMKIINRLTSEAGTIALSGTTHTLTLSDGILSDGHHAVLVFGGSPTGTNTVTISPNDAQRVFIVQNSSGQSVVLTQGTGGNVNVADNSQAIVYCDGAGTTAQVVDVTTTYLRGENNLSDLGDAATALTNLGLTATAADLNKLDGMTASTAELNTMDGITASTAELNKLDGMTTSTAELNILDGVTASTAELNLLDGVTASTSELNTVDGVTSPIQTQLDSKYEASTQSASAWEAGTSTTESLVSPAKVKSAVEAGGGPTAWVKFNGTGGVAVVSGKNVSSVIRNGVGDYTVNFENSLSSADYLVSVTVVGDASNATRYAQTGSVHPSTAPSVDSVRISTGITGSNFSGGKLVDLPFVWVAVWEE